MKKITIMFLIISSSILFLYILAVSVYAAEPLFDADNPADLGTVAASYQPALDQGGWLTQWKTVRVQATSSGTVTHFLIKLCGTTGITTSPVGFAVYEGTSGYNDPVGTLIARGYYAAYSFGSGAGWYALPFNIVPTTFTVTAGNYYHLTYLIERIEAGENYCRANNADPYPPKWLPSCSGGNCLPETPPGVGGVTWTGQFPSSSAPWVMGLLGVAGDGDIVPPSPPTGVTII